MSTVVSMARGVRGVGTVMAMSMASVLWTGGNAARANDQIPEDAVLGALAAELERAMTLELEDLPRPYFVQYTVNETRSVRLSAAQGALQGASEDHARRLWSQVRVGSYDLDNTGFAEAGVGARGGRRAGGGGGAALGGGGAVALPIDDDLGAIRQAAWLVTDAEYKSAAETLARKRTYLEEHRLKDVPPSYTPGDARVQLDPVLALEVDRERWQEQLRQVSARFARHAGIHDSGVSLGVVVETQRVLNSEGLRLRTSTRRYQLVIQALARAQDGAELTDRREFLAETELALPALEALLSEVDRLAERLQAAVTASSVGHYSGPVLFTGEASAQFFATLLASGLEGRPEPVGAGRRRGGGGSLARLLDKSVLPSGFNAFDDPSIEEVDGVRLAGHYRIDDEGVDAQRVDLIADGVLRDLVRARAPHKAGVRSSGHGRGRGGSAQASIGCLVIECRDGQDRAALVEALRAAADDQGLEYGLVVQALSLGTRARRIGAGGGDAQSLPDPLYVTKIFVEDGREEAVGRVEIAPVTLRALRRIIAGGSDRNVHNIGGFASAAPASVVAPSILVEELELNAIDEERPRPPAIAPPHARPLPGESEPAPATRP